MNEKEKMIDDALQSLKASLETHFPMGVPRSELSRATGGILHARTQANRDSAGDGIEERFRVGRTVVYAHAGIMRYMRQRMMA